MGGEREGCVWVEREKGVCGWRERRVWVGGEREGCVWVERKKEWKKEQIGLTKVAKPSFQLFKAEIYFER